MKILVTGSTGYIGGRLVPRLLELGHAVTVLVRDPERISGRPWRNQVAIIEGDLLDKSGPWFGALSQFDAAYYLVHSIYAGRDYAELDRKAAGHFVEAAQGIAHVIYLGGLLPEGKTASQHLSSRAETGQILRDGLPVTEFRAGPIIGSGSASFEMVRYLTERLPVMVAPKWIMNPVQCIAVRDILAYLLAALDTTPQGVVNVGTTPLTFKAMMETYADVCGYPRVIIPLPVLTPGLAARWVGLVTPIPNSLAVPLIAGVVQPLTADTQKARQHFPAIQPIPCRRAMELALDKIKDHAVETRWSGAMGEVHNYRLVDWEGMIREERCLPVQASQDQVYRTFCSLGGDRGWLVWNWTWRLRGWMDRIVGGPGLRRGRRDPQQLLPGEALDFWRVEKVVPGHLLLLRAEMKVPGKAWLRFETETLDGTVRVRQTALFQPRGFWGALYWYALYPIHKIIFSDMVKALRKAAEAEALSPPPSPESVPVR
jgi:uncharacterized protein YbjT (DUF2867 family)